MKLIIVRHGVTDANVADISQDESSPLNAEGLVQAEKLAHRLQEEPIYGIYSSDFIRCRQMVDAISRHHSTAPVHYLAVLRERNKGIFVGRPKDELLEASKIQGVPEWSFKPEGGESFVNACSRVKPFIQMIETTEKKKTILVVTHSLIARALFQILFNLPYEEAFKTKKENASVSIIQVNDTKPHIAHIINDTRHLT